MFGEIRKMMVLRQIASRWWMFIAGGMVVVIGLTFGTHAITDHGLGRMIAATAGTEAKRWADVLADELRDPATRVAGEQTHAAPPSALALAGHIGRVFHVRLYDADGRLVRVYDRGEERAPQALHVLDPRAADVAATGRTSVELRAGRRDPSRPTLYAEAYVPVRSAAGAISGVAAISMDETATVRTYREVFMSMATWLALLMAFAFAVPAFALFLRSRQARRAHERIRYMARHDTLTGLLNRASFAEQVAERAEDCRRSGRKLVMAYIDVDNFKTINDEHGHQGGDAFLRHVARCLTANVRASDLVARLGGDEFGLAMTFETVRDLHRHIDRIRLAVMQPVVVGGRSVAGHISIGVYVADSEDRTVDALMHRADVALYQAKSEGRDTCRMFAPEMHERMRRRRALEVRLREALADGTFELHYQPRLDLRTRAYASFEALLRLPDGKGGYIAPDQFIPAAEATGLINRIGAWVLHTATRAAAGWPEPLAVSVNLSIEQFRDGRLPECVRAALAASGLAPRRLELEVPERLLTDTSGAIDAQLAALRALGVTVAVDDFGTGSSSFAALWRAGFDRLKIDRSFVRALARDPSNARDVLETMVLLAHRLGLQVTAEGIETAEEAETLSALACDELQGFLYGQPVPADEIDAVLAREADALPGQRDVEPALAVPSRS